MLAKHLNKNNLHHAYLIEGEREEIVREVLKFVEDLKIKTTGNADFSQITLDSFKVDDARNLKSIAMEKGFSNSKRIFIISANTFLLEAQNTLLKIFEEPIENTHFFVVVPDANTLLKTLVSRFYFISTRQDLVEDTIEAEKFLHMSLQKRIDFIKELLPKKDEDSEDENEENPRDSNHTKAIKFLNAIESLVHAKIAKDFSGLTLPGVPVGAHTVQNPLLSSCEQFFKVRELLRMPGSSAKTLMESVALIVPIF